MPWQCRIITTPSTPEEWQGVRVGDMWYDHASSVSRRPFLLAPEHVDKRPLIVRLPGPVAFAIYGPTWANGRPGPAGWIVTGDPPLLTLSPSINVGNVYHGYIQVGVITDDIDGRVFNADGGRIYAQP